MSDERALPVIFSLKDGNVWVTRNDNGPSVMLGAHDDVIKGMHDFIRQAEFAQRLLSKATKTGVAPAYRITD